MDFFFGSLFPIFFTLIFLLVFGMIVFTIIRNISQWNKNNHSPRLTVEAAGVSKRENVSPHHHHHSDGTMHTSTSTTYYVTFQVQSGDRMEFPVSGREYGMLAEGDFGNLTFQGTWYLGFERK